MDPQVVEALKTVSELKDLVQRKLADIEKGHVSDGEVKEQFQRQFTDLNKQIDELKRGTLPAANPLAVIEEKMNQQRGALFGGRMRLPYARAMSLPAYHPALRDSDKDQLQSLQDLNDAVVLRYWHERFKNRQMDNGRLLDIVVRGPEFRDYFLGMARAGYASGADIQKFAETVLSADPAQQNRANEIMHPGSGGVGASLNFTLLSAQLIDMVRIELGLANEFVDVPLPRAQTDFPSLTGDTMAVLGGFGGSPDRTIPSISLTSGSESVVTMPPTTALTSPTFKTVSFRAVHLLGFLLWNDDMFEDSVIPWLPLMRTMVARALARGMDTAVLNGTRSGTTHIDDDVTNAWDVRKSWHGLRKLGHTTKVTHSGALLTTGGLRKNRANMGIYGRNPLELFHIVHVAGWYELMKASEVLTVEQFGNEATVKRGVLAKLDGVDLKMSEFLRTDLNASGKFDNVTLTKTISLCVNKTRFMNGTFGQPQVEETRVAPALSTLLQIDVRRDFKPMEQTTAASNTEFASGVTPVSVLYDVLVA